MSYRSVALTACCLSAALLSPPLSYAAEEASGLAISEGTVASIQYTLKDDQGGQIETSEGGEPVSYVHGESAVVPGLKKALAGMHKGDERDVKVTPEDGFGEVDPRAFQEIPKEKLPPEALEVGTVLQARSPEGVVVPVRVSELKDETAVIDFNHPLAGKTLVFHIKVLDVKKAPPTEAPPAEAPPAPEASAP